MSTKHDTYRRDVVSFDARYFEKQNKLGNKFNLLKTFYHINEINLWGSSESASGEGSTSSETAEMKKSLYEIFNSLSIKSVVDAGCGDFGWLGSMSLQMKYDGFDIIPRSIKKLKNTFKENARINFHLDDFIEADLPKSDLILCRDCLVHFSFYDIKKALLNFKNSGSKYLLATNFSDSKLNEDIITGDWRTLNFELNPFNFPWPENVIVEGCMQNDGLYKDKSLALWDLSKIEV